MTKEELLQELAGNTWVMIKPSHIEGIGVFALRDIPEGCRSMFSKAMADEKMNWTQLVDFKGFEGEIAQAYNILGIPHSILLDEEGRVIKIGLRGAFLDIELNKLKKS